MSRVLMFASLVVLSLLAAGVQAQSLVTRYVAGQDYHVIDTAPSPGQNGPVHVTEFFLYTCPHCYHFDPTLSAWVKQHPNVVFDRVPVLFGQGGLAYARLYYTEKRLGEVDTLHKRIFDAIHQDGRPLATRAAQRAFMVANGVSGSRFDAAYDSPEVDRAVQRVAQRMQHFRVTAVPSMAVGERYWVSGQTAGSNDRMLKVVDDLIRRSRDQHGAPKTSQPGVAG